MNYKISLIDEERLEKEDHVGYNQITENLQNKLKDKISIIVRTPNTTQDFYSNQVYFNI